ncbi:pullulanase-associated domain-containing protein [Candidatus Albibeggiatoa sp. nov. NOAA]|uniref:pullulanase-associated domain-containing protein n=1 Tax=Candidatus Albibeggiatoa sp. nov. NOAA TaxID=3162724 RepID=UPI0032F628A8|nr:hypothetical protein [Thiotrichaceae bacterium]
MIVHYHRYVGDHESWKLSIWEAGTQIINDIVLSATDNFGVSFLLNDPRFKPNQQLEFHFKSSKVKEKDSLLRSEAFENKKEIWVFQDSAKIFTLQPEIKASLTTSKEIKVDFPVLITSQQLQTLNITMDSSLAKYKKRNNKVSVNTRNLELTKNAKEGSQIKLTLNKPISLNDKFSICIRGFKPVLLTDQSGSPIKEQPKKTADTETIKAQLSKSIPKESPRDSTLQPEQGESTIMGTPQNPTPNKAEQKAESKQQPTQPEKTPVATPEVVTMAVDNEKLQQELQASTENLLAELEKLQGQAKNLNTSLKTDSLDPDGNYIFAKEIIDNDISALQSAYRGLQDLVIRIQSDQTKMDKRLQSDDADLKKDLNNKFAKLQDQNDDLNKSLAEADRKNRADLTEHILKVQTDLTNELKGAQSELTNNLNGVQSELTNTINGVQADLTNNLNGSSGELTNRINGVESELTSSITTLQERLGQTQNDLSAGIGNVQSELKDATRTIETDIRNLTTNTENDVRNLTTNYDRQNGDLNSAQIKITENSRAADTLRNELTKLRSEYQELKASKEDSLRKLAQYVNRLAVITGKDKDLERYNLNEAMKKLEGKGSAK